MSSVNSLPQASKSPSSAMWRSGSVFIKSATLFLMSLIMDIVALIELLSCNE
jgi:hypothetical protein